MVGSSNSKIRFGRGLPSGRLIKDVTFRQREKKATRLPQRTTAIPVSRLAPSRLEDLYQPHNVTKQILELIWPEVGTSSLQPENYLDAMLKLSKRAPELLKDKQLRPLGKLLAEEREMHMLLYGYRNQVVMV